MEFDKLIEEMEDNDEGAVMNAPKSFVNQPSLLTVSSVNGEIQNTYNNTSYYSFIVNLPRPMLDIQSLQLLSTNIPQANTNISDTACVFWYYRLSGYSGNIPNYNNLFMVRLLPSYYKREFIANPNNYAYNRTFKSYADLGTELAKACSYDLAWSNFLTLLTAFPGTNDIYTIPFIPNNISLTYSSALNKFQFTGIPTTPVFVYWAFLGVYAINDIIAYEGQVFKSKQNGNTGQYPATSGVVNSVWWDCLYSTEAVATWDSNTTYPINRYVSYKNTLYKSTYTTLSFPPDAIFPSWDNATQYYRGSIVTYSGDIYTAVNPNYNSVPSGLNWVLLDWAYPFSYQTGMVVKYGANYYIASTNISTPTAPPSNSFWILVGENFWTPATLPDTTNNLPCYNYLSTGFNDPNVISKQATGRQTWNQYNLYEQNQLVGYDGSYWENTRQSQGETPFRRDNALAYSSLIQYNAGDVVLFNSEYYIATGTVIGVTPNPAFTNWRQENWVVVFLSLPPVVALAEISKDLDMTQVITAPTTFVETQVPFGIPPQPYSVVPKRLLNTILGFTWNGNINSPIYRLINLDTGIPIVDETTAREYNRLRPVPRYSVNDELYSTVLSLLGTSENTYTYTADGFANLVYSSIISLYTSIAGSSTLDTQRDTNLLAIVSMNCSNLGVSFWNNFIDNPLMKVQGSIYSVYIELRDEYGDPYYLTNNAVSTFVFKVKYKE